jgi:hypothetical protein
MKSEANDVVEIEHNDGSIETLSLSLVDGVLVLVCNGEALKLSADASMHLCDFLVINVEKLRKYCDEASYLL